MSPQKSSLDDSPQTVLIAPSGRVAEAEACLPPAQAGSLLTFTDADVQAAVEAIADTHPSTVALERSFAVSPRGGALVNRLRRDSALRGIVIQVVDAEDESRRVLILPPQAIIPSADSIAPDLTPPDYRGTRQAPRVGFDLGVLVKVDGDPATVVDMSHLGAQILIAQPLRPGQRVRIWSDRPRGTFRCGASVVWVRYELHAGSGGYYRAGCSFIDAHPESIDVFCADRAAAVAVA